MRLDLRALVTGGSGGSASLESPGTHPLLKLGLVLDDLEAWHRDEGRPDASLEARLERLRCLHDVWFEPLTVLVAAELERIATIPGEGGAWHPMVGLELVEVLSRWHRVGDSAGMLALVEAAKAESTLELVLARCDAVASSLRRRELSVEGMVLDGPGRRSLVVQHRNLERVWLRAHRIDPEEELRDPWNGPSYVPPETFQRLAAGVVPPDAEWSVDLQGHTDLERHRSSLTMPDLHPGFYAVLISPDPGFGSEDNEVHGIELLVTCLLYTSDAADE